MIIRVEGISEEYDFSRVPTEKVKRAHIVVREGGKEVANVVVEEGKTVDTDPVTME